MYFKTEVRNTKYQHSEILPSKAKDDQSADLQGSTEDATIYGHPLDLQGRRFIIKRRDGDEITIHLSDDPNDYPGDPNDYPVVNFKKDLKEHRALVANKHSHDTEFIQPEQESEEQEERLIYVENSNEDLKNKHVGCLILEEENRQAFVLEKETSNFLVHENIPSSATVENINPSTTPTEIIDGTCSAQKPEFRNKDSPMILINKTTNLNICNVNNENVLSETESIIVPSNTKTDTKVTDDTCNALSDLIIEDQKSHLRNSSASYCQLSEEITKMSLEETLIPSLALQAKESQNDCAQIDFNESDRKKIKGCDTELVKIDNITDVEDNFLPDLVIDDGSISSEEEKHSADTISPTIKNLESPSPVDIKSDDSIVFPVSNITDRKASSLQDTESFHQKKCEDDLKSEVNLKLDGQPRDKEGFSEDSPIEKFMNEFFSNYDSLITPIYKTPNLDTGDLNDKDNVLSATKITANDTAALSVQNSHEKDNYHIDCPLPEKTNLNERTSLEDNISVDIASDNNSTCLSLPVSEKESSVFSRQCHIFNSGLTKNKNITDFEQSSDKITDSEFVTDESFHQKNSDDDLTTQTKFKLNLSTDNLNTEYDVLSDTKQESKITDSNCAALSVSIFDDPNSHESESKSRNNELCSNDPPVKKLRTESCLRSQEEEEDYSSSEDTILRQTNETSPKKKTSIVLFSDENNEYVNSVRKTSHSEESHERESKSRNNELCSNDPPVKKLRTESCLSSQEEEEDYSSSEETILRQTNETSPKKKTSIVLFSDENNEYVNSVRKTSHSEESHERESKSRNNELCSNDPPVKKLRTESCLRPQEEEEDYSSSEETILRQTNDISTREKTNYVPFSDENKEYVNGVGKTSYSEESYKSESKSRNNELCSEVPPVKKLSMESCLRSQEEEEDYSSSEETIIRRSNAIITPFSDENNEYVSGVEKISYSEERHEKNVSIQMPDIITDDDDATLESKIYTPKEYVHSIQKTKNFRRKKCRSIRSPKLRSGDCDLSDWRNVLTEISSNPCCLSNDAPSLTFVSESTKEASAHNPEQHHRKINKRKRDFDLLLNSSSPIATKKQKRSNISSRMHVNIIGETEYRDLHSSSFWKSSSFLRFRNNLSDSYPSRNAQDCNKKGWECWRKGEVCYSLVNQNFATQQPEELYAKNNETYECSTCYFFTSLIDNILNHLPYCRGDINMDKTPKTQEEEIRKTVVNHSSNQSSSSQNMPVVLLKRLTDEEICTDYPTRPTSKRKYRATKPKRKFYRGYKRKRRSRPRKGSSSSRITYNEHSRISENLPKCEVRLHRLSSMNIDDDIVIDEDIKKYQFTDVILKENYDVESTESNHDVDEHDFDQRPDVPTCVINSDIIGEHASVMETDSLSSYGYNDDFMQGDNLGFNNNVGYEEIIPSSDVPSKDVNSAAVTERINDLEKQFDDKYENSSQSPDEIPSQVIEEKEVIAEIITDMVEKAEKNQISVFSLNPDAEINAEDKLSQPQVRNDEVSKPIASSKKTSYSEKTNCLKRNTSKNDNKVVASNLKYKSLKKKQRIRYLTKSDKRAFLKYHKHWKSYLTPEDTTWNADYGKLNMMENEISLEGNEAPTKSNQKEDASDVIVNNYKHDKIPVQIKPKNNTDIEELENKQNESCLSPETYKVVHFLMTFSDVAGEIDATDKQSQMNKSGNDSEFENMGEFEYSTTTEPLSPIMKQSFSDANAYEDSTIINLPGSDTAHDTTFAISDNPKTCDSINNGTTDMNFSGNSQIISSKTERLHQYIRKLSVATNGKDVKNSKNNLVNDNDCSNLPEREQSAGLINNNQTQQASHDSTQFTCALVIKENTNISEKNNSQRVAMNNVNVDIHQYEDFPRNKIVLQNSIDVHSDSNVSRNAKISPNINQMKVLPSSTITNPIRGNRPDTPNRPECAVLPSFQSFYKQNAALLGNFNRLPNVSTFSTSQQPIAYNQVQLPVSNPLQVHGHQPNTHQSIAINPVQLPVSNPNQAHGIQPNTHPTDRTVSHRSCSHMRTVAPNPQMQMNPYTPNVEIRQNPAIPGQQTFIQCRSRPHSSRAVRCVNNNCLTHLSESTSFLRPPSHASCRFSVRPTFMPQQPTGNIPVGYYANQHHAIRSNIQPTNIVPNITNAYNHQRFPNRYPNAPVPQRLMTPRIPNVERGQNQDTLRQDMRIQNGSGLSSMEGVPPVNNNIFVRPPYESFYTDEAHNVNNTRVRQNPSNSARVLNVANQRFYASNQMPQLHPPRMLSMPNSSRPNMNTIEIAFQARINQFLP